MTLKFLDHFTNKIVETQPWQEAMRPGDCYCIDEPRAGYAGLDENFQVIPETAKSWSLGMTIYGVIMEADPGDPPLEPGFVWVQAYSEIEPEGEYGTQCITDFTYKLSPEQFGQARLAGWPAIEELAADWPGSVNLPQQGRKEE